MANLLEQEQWLERKAALQRQSSMTGGQMDWHHILLLSI